MDALSPVHEIFNDRSVLITGASGFIGKVLLEKLLRTYLGIKTIYVLLRTKKDQPPSERLHNGILNVALFDTIRAMENGKEILNKIVVIPGDITKANLGISEEDLKRMLDDKSLSIVFNSAASVRFDLSLKRAIDINLRATKRIIKLCKMIPNLICLCHVSTAYVNANIKDNSIIFEQPCSLKEDPRDLLTLNKILDEESLELLKDKFLGEQPNTYTYTKAAAELLIHHTAKDLPVSIVRPSIVSATFRDPFPGWVDSFATYAGLIVVVGKGLVRSMQCGRDYKLEGVPVDLVVNNLISSVYYMSKVNKNLGSLEKNQDLTSCIKNRFREGNNEAKHVYFHCSQEKEGIISIEYGIEYFTKKIIQNPSIEIFRYPSISVMGKFRYYLSQIFDHWLPVYLVDTLFILSGKKPQLVKTYRKINEALIALRPFTQVNYNLDKTNQRKLVASLEHPLDQNQLYMDTTNIGNEFFDNFVLGVRYVKTCLWNLCDFDRIFIN